MRQRRRAERKNTYANSRSLRLDAGLSEHYRQRLLIWFGSIVALALVILLAFGSYTNAFKPPRQTVAEVAGQNIQLRDVIPASRILAAALAASDRQSAVFEPSEALELLVGNRVLANSVIELGVTPPSNLDINAVLARAFESARLGESNMTSLGELGQAKYSEFLLNVGVSDADYREYISGDIMRKAVTEHYETLVPVEQDAVNLSWIIASTSLDAQNAWSKILAGEPFDSVASEYNKEKYYSDEYGKIGWVPKGAFPEFDGQVFQAKKGEIIGPINSSLGFVVLQVNETVKSTTINNELHELLVRRQADDWFTQKTADLISYIDFDKNDADWIVENLR